MTKASKMTANRLTVSRTVHSSVQTHGSEVAEALTRALFPDGLPAKLTSARLLAAIGAVLERADAEVAATDLAHTTELADDEETRRRRDEAIVAVRERLIGLRELLSGLFGTSLLGAYALDEAVPDTAQLLLARAAATAKLLQSRPLRDKPRRPGIAIEPKQLAADLLAAHAELLAALEASKREEREAQLTLEAKTRAAQSWQEAYHATSSAFYGLYLLAGRKDLAERINPTYRRRAGLPEDGGDPSTPEPAPAPPPPSPA